MNSIIESLNLWGARFLEFAIPILWQSTLLIVLIFVLDFALRRKVRAAVRYALWFVVLLKLLLPPTLALPTGAAWWLLSNKAQAPVVPRKILSVSYPEPADYVPQPATTVSLPPPPPPQLSAAAWMLLTSTAGSIFLLTWLLARWRQIALQIRASSAAPSQIVALFNHINHEMKSRTHEPHRSAAVSAASSGGVSPPDSCTGTVRELAGEGACATGEQRILTKLRLGFRRTPQIRLVPAPISPAVCGLFRPVILLPQSLAEKLSPAQLRAVLLHELIHLRRRDVWMNCFQTFLQIAYWWHPLLWLANARIRRLREESVDDAVMLALNENSEVYAPTLLEVAKLAFNRPLASLGLVGILESTNALRQRIERLLNFTTPRKAGLSVMSVVCIAAFTAIAVPMGEAPARSSDPGAGLDSTNLIPYHTKVNPDVFIRNIRARATETLHTTNEHWGEILLSIFDGYGIDCTPPRGIALNTQTGELTTTNTSEALQVLNEVIHELNLPGGERILNPPHGLKQVLIEAQFYQMQPEEFAQLGLDPSHKNRNGDSSPSWNLSSNELSQATQRIRQLGLEPFSSPRIQTSHGITAELNTGDKTNSVDLECLPFIHDGAVDLTVLARTTGQSAPPGGWPDFADYTNCAIFSRIGFEDGGGAVLQAQPTGTTPESNLVVFLHARIIHPSLTGAHENAPLIVSIDAEGVLRLGAEARVVTAEQLKSELAADVAKKPDLQLAVSADKAAPFEQIIKVMDAAKEAKIKTVNAITKDSVRPATANYRPPTNSTPQATGPTISYSDSNSLLQDGKLLFERGKLDEAEARFKAVLHGEPDNRAAQYYLNLVKDVRKKANAAPVDNHPEREIKPRFIEVAATRDDSVRTSAPAVTNLVTRTFQLDPNTLCRNLQSLGFANFGPRTRVGTGYVQATASKTEIQIGLINFFQATGVDLSPPKSVLFEDHQNTLTVHATPHDLDLVQAAINTLNVAPPEVNVKARFVEVAATRDSSGRIHPVPNAFTDFMKNVLTNKSESSEFISGILSEAQMKSALKLMQTTDSDKFLNDGQVTTLSGRQAQFYDVTVHTIVDGLDVKVTNNQTGYNYQTTNMNFGYVLDVLPEILSDQRAVSLKLTPEVTEFLGYADPKEISKYDKNLQHAQFPLPKYRRWSITTTAIVPDGQTLVLANLGDEILVGTAPSYKAKPLKNPAKQLLVFITPTLIDQAGNRLYAARTNDYYDSARDYFRALHSKDYYDFPVVY
jgi:beta-lactamase regulating signal transducer with metallopeptidase domain